MKLARLVTLGSAALFSIVAGCAEPQPSPTSDMGTDVGTTKQALDSPTGFDFDNGNFIRDYFLLNFGPIVQSSGAISGGDASIIITQGTLLVSGWFDAMAPYSDTMVGIHSQIPRRPAAERATNRGRNIASAHAAYRILEFVLPQFIPQIRPILQAKGIDPDDNSMDLTTPAGIGNYAARAVIADRARDGMNVDGAEDGRKYNRRMYDDYTGYEPYNSPFELRDPSRWQPKVVTRGFGLFQIQKFVTPQWARTRPFSYSKKDLKKLYRAPTPTNSDPKRHMAEYKAQADEVLAASAALDDKTKMVAELFNHKNQSLGRGADFISRRDNMTMEQWVQFELAWMIATFDGGIAIWDSKVEYDTVRPWTAIKYLYGKKKVRAWGGVGQGTVNDLPAEEWESYIPTADHPEYPSGSSCFCSATAQVGRRWTGSDHFGWDVVRLKGSSVIEPGITPAADLTMHFETFTQWQTDCAQSRVNGGVHFRAAVEASKPICTAIADRAYDFVQPYINGTATPGAKKHDDDE